MRISQDTKKYLKYFLDSICFQGELQISAIKRMAQLKGQGAEYISCSFDPDDEDYQEGYVILVFWKPAEDEDTMVFVENGMFYEHLSSICEECIKKEPGIKDELEDYLNQVKKSLKV